MVDDFIGERFGEDGHLEVVGRCGYIANTIKAYSVRCHVCDRDREIFQEGTIFKSTKQKLKSGCIPCGCSRLFSYNRRQKEIRAIRLCEGKPFTFVGLSVEENNTKVILNCGIHDHTWETDRSNITLGQGCWHCGNAKIGRVAKENRSLATSDTLVKSTSKTHFEYACPTCSDDEYVKANVCSGLFRTSYKEFKEGVKSCRCSLSYRWTEEQRVYQVKKHIETLKNYTKFLGWHGPYIKSKSRVSLECSIHGVWDIALSKILYRGAGCRDCAEGGYKPKAEESCVYIIRASNSTTNKEFTGYGITAKIETRLSVHRCALLKSGYTISEQEVFYTTGKVALEIENLLKQRYEWFPQSITGFKREATHSYLYGDAIEFVENYLNTE